MAWSHLNRTPYQITVYRRQSRALLPPEKFPATKSRCVEQQRCYWILISDKRSP